MIASDFLLCAILLPIVIVTAFFALEVFIGLSPLSGQWPKRDGGRAVIVIPAHDEQAVIEQTVAGLLAEGKSEFAVLVIADNCADETAAIARRAGAQVLVREDAEHRGKGFALTAAREHLKIDSPDVIIVVDADCRLDGGGLHALAAAAASTGRACQAVNLLAPDLDGPAMVQISTFAFMIKNLVRQRGLQRMSGRAHLTGTGMALPWRIFERADLGGANIVEDLALGLALAEKAAPPMLLESATVWSPPATQVGTLVQRRRWEGGYLATALSMAPKAFARSLARADVRGLFAALDLSVPPLALLVVLNATAAMLALGAVLLGAPAWPMLVQVAVGAAAIAAVALAWMREGRRFASGSTLLRLPIYVAWKLPMYLGLVRRGAPKEWLRSGR